VKDYGRYQYYINGLWNSLYSQISLTGKYFAYSPVIVQGPNILKTWFSVTPVMSTTKDDLIAAVRALKYLFIQLSAGVAAPNLSTKIYTNGSDKFVEHPKFGRLPGGIRFIDLSEWDGENRTWEAKDLSYTG
jgi:hypothetical protein